MIGLVLEQPGEPLTRVGWASPGIVASFFAIAPGEERFDEGIGLHVEGLHEGVDGRPTWETLAPLESRDGAVAEAGELRQALLRVAEPGAAAPQRPTESLGGLAHDHTQPAAERCRQARSMVSWGCGSHSTLGRYSDWLRVATGIRPSGIRHLFRSDFA